jgi:hypothetical protein
LRQYATGLAGLELTSSTAEATPSVDFGLILGLPPLPHANFWLKHVVCCIIFRSIPD